MRFLATALPACAALSLGASRVPPFPTEPLIDAEMFPFDGAHTEIGFSIRFMGLTNVRGRFNSFSGTIMYVEKDIARSTVTVSIQAKSIDTGSDWRDNDLRSPSFFAVDSFPTIFFQSARIEQRPGGFVVWGPLTMRGVTREIAIPFVVVHGKMKDAWENTRIGFAGSLRLNRKDYGITGTNFWNSVVDLTRMALADTVEIELNIQGRISNFERWSFPARPNTKSLGELMWQTINERGMEAAVAQHAQLKRDTAAYSTGSLQLNIIGYKLLQRGRIDDAIRVFRLNLEAFPEEGALWDSLAEAYAANGDRALAIQHYENALAMDPHNTGAMEMLRWLTADR